MSICIFCAKNSAKLKEWTLLFNLIVLNEVNELHTTIIISIKTSLSNFIFNKTGGETIKDINRRSGALCEIDKAYKNTDGPDKYFIIRGSQDQILYCQQLIYEKITGVSN